MRLSALIICTLLLAAGCKTKSKPAFDARLFLDAAVTNELLSKPEAEQINIQLQGVPNTDIRVVAYLSKKINYQNVSGVLNFTPVNLDSAKSFKKLFYSQLEQRRPPTPEGTMMLKQPEKMLKGSTGFLKNLYDNGYLSPTQYAKTTEKIKAEPFPFPFLTFELIETMQ